jgi:hypothetical protein
LQQVAPLSCQWLDMHYTQHAARIMARIQEMRGGKDYYSDFDSGIKGQRFEKTCHRLGFNRARVELDSSQFRPGAVTGQDSPF